MGNLAVALKLLKTPKVLHRVIKSRLSVNSKLNRSMMIPSRKINLMVLVVTRRCNMYCEFCMQDHDAHRQPELNRIGLGDYRRVLDQAKIWNPTIQLTGGEPFIYPEIEELINVIKEKNFFCIANTNGSTLKNHAKQLVELGLEKIAISLDGPPEVHDHVRQFDNAYQLAEEGIRALANEKKRQGKSYPLVAVTSVINPTNTGYLEPIVKLAQTGLVQMVNFVHVWYLHQSQIDLQKSQGIEIEHYPAHTFKMFTQEELKDALYHVRDLQQRYKNLPFIVFPDIPDNQMDFYYSNPCKRLHREKCVYPHETIRVLPSGDVVSCPEDIAAKGYLGNIRQESLNDIVYGDLAKKFLYQLEQDGGAWPICNRCCGIFRS